MITTSPRRPTNDNDRRAPRQHFAGDDRDWSFFGWVRCPAAHSSYNDGAIGGHYRAGRLMYKVGAPYKIGGVWYYPAVNYNYDEPGVASWYGEQFDQQYTANGEIFDLNQLTAAHRTLPMPRIVGLGPLPTVEQADQLFARVVDSGHPEARIVVD